MGVGPTNSEYPIIQGDVGGAYVVKIINTDSQTLLSNFTIQNGNSFEGGMYMLMEHHQL